VGHSKGNIQLGRPRRRLGVNIKMDHRKILWGGMDWIYSAHDMISRGLL
jgi:hypothetical protein